MVSDDLPLPLPLLLRFVPLARVTWRVGAVGSLGKLRAAGHERQLGARRFRFDRLGPFVGRINAKSFEHGATGLAEEGRVRRADVALARTAILERVGVLRV